MPEEPAAKRKKFNLGDLKNLFTRTVVFNETSAENTSIDEESKGLTQSWYDYDVRSFIQQATSTTVKERTAAAATLTPQTGDFAPTPAMFPPG